jgi:predicted transcriptional regulator
MELKIKSSQQVTVRLPVDLVERLDFVARNTDADEITSRSAAILEAVEWWLPGAEQRLREVGLEPPKKR